MSEQAVLGDFPTYYSQAISFMLFFNILDCIVLLLLK